jgi:hypothetical protein
MVDAVVRRAVEGEEEKLGDEAVGSAVIAQSLALRSEWAGGRRSVVWSS